MWLTEPAISSSPVLTRAVASAADWQLAWVFSMALTDELTPWVRRVSISLISEVLAWVRAARARTSSATTAKPRPCSPARAASMAALRASRLVWPAMAPITPRISVMRWASCCMLSTLWVALATSSINAITLLDASPTTTRERSAFSLAR
ncbi:hypothetical protein D3C84_553680 [compost metagenome]